MIKLGDMTVLGDVPAKMLKALAVIADTLHPAFARQPWIAGNEKSKESCVLCALTVRDFLVGIGFADAVVRPVITIMMAWRDGKQLHSLGIGVPGTPREDGRWVGHLVVDVPSAKTLIDVTLYRTVRDQWPDLPGMLALDTSGFGCWCKINGRKVIVAATMTDEDDPAYSFEIVYLDNPSNKSWRKGPDSESWRRAVVTAALVERFGQP